MNVNLDPAIAEAVGLDPTVTTLARHGGSGFTSTFRLSSVVDGEEKVYFVKTGTDPSAALMFQGKMIGSRISFPRYIAGR
jgi:protein-ribulosamine 3-kinase